MCCEESLNRWLCPKCGHHIHSKRERHVEICDGLGAGAHLRSEKARRRGRGWNKGATLVQETRNKISASLTGKPWRPKSIESDLARRQKISDSMKRNPKAGGYRKGSGVGKGCWYESHIAGEVYLDSTFEKRFAVVLDKLNEAWQRNKQKFLYNYSGKEHFYTPDFVINETFIEVKGYVTGRDLAKWKCFPHRLVIVREADIIDLESGGLPKWS